MKKIFSALLAVILCSAVIGPGAFAAGERKYLENTGVSCEVPDNWVQQEPVVENNCTIIIFIPDGDETTLIMYTRLDMSDLVEDEPDITAADIDTEFLVEWGLLDSYGIEESKADAVSFGDAEYIKVEGTFGSEELKELYGENSETFMRAENAVFHMFQFFGAKDGAAYDDFISFMDSISYACEPVQPEEPAAAEKNEPATTDNPIIDRRAGSMQRIWVLILDLAICAAVTLLPMIIYRYACKKEPSEKKNAVKISVIYGICAFVIVSMFLAYYNGVVFAGIIIIPCSYWNYRILVSGKTENDEPAAAAESTCKAPAEHPVVDIVEQTPATQTQEKTEGEIYCSKCGAALAPGARFCGVCGAKTDENEDQAEVQK